MKECDNINDMLVTIQRQLWPVHLIWIAWSIEKQILGEQDLHLFDLIDQLIYYNHLNFMAFKYGSWHTGLIPPSPVLPWSLAHPLQDLILILFLFPILTNFLHHWAECCFLSPEEITFDSSCLSVYCPTFCLLFASQWAYRLLSVCWVPRYQNSSWSISIRTALAKVQAFGPSYYAGKLVKFSISQYKL